MQLTFQMIKEAYDRCINQGMRREPPVISWNAHLMLNRILLLVPNFQFSTETEIWYKAYQLGLK